MLLGFSTNVFANSSSDKDYAEGIEEIEKTNEEIEKEIVDAVEKADKLSEEYLQEIRGEEATKLIELEQEKAQLLEELKAVATDEKKTQKINKKIEKLDAKIAKATQKAAETVGDIQEDIDAFMEVFEQGNDVTDEFLYTETRKLSAKLGGESELVKETEEYTEELNKVVKDCFDKTLEMSNKALAKAAEKGVHAECTWKLVRFGHKWVWIDPLRIVGRY